MSRASFFPARNKKGELKSLYGAEEARLGTVCHAVFAFRNLAQERSRATAQLAPVRTYTVDETIKWAAYEPKAVDDVVRIGEKKLSSTSRGIPHSHKRSRWNANQVIQQDPALVVLPGRRA